MKPSVASLHVLWWLAALLLSAEGSVLGGDEADHHDRRLLVDDDHGVVTKQNVTVEKDWFVNTAAQQYVFANDSDVSVSYRPHDQDCFTEGFVFVSHDVVLESCGQSYASFLQKYNWYGARAPPSGDRSSVVLSTPNTSNSSESASNLLSSHHPPSFQQTQKQLLGQADGIDASVSAEGIAVVGQIVYMLTRNTSLLLRWRLENLDLIDKGPVTTAAKMLDTHLYYYHRLLAERRRSSMAPLSGSSQHGSPRQSNSGLLPVAHGSDKHSVDRADGSDEMGEAHEEEEEKEKKQKKDSHHDLHTEATPSQSGEAFAAHAAAVDDAILSVPPNFKVLQSFSTGFVSPIQLGGARGLTYDTKRHLLYSTDGDPAHGLITLDPVSRTAIAYTRVFCGEAHETPPPAGQTGARSSEQEAGTLSQQLHHGHGTQPQQVLSEPIRWLAGLQYIEPLDVILANVWSTYNILVLTPPAKRGGECLSVVHLEDLYTKTKPPTHSPANSVLEDGFSAIAWHPHEGAGRLALPRKQTRETMEIVVKDLSAFLKVPLPSQDQFDDIDFSALQAHFRSGELVHEAAFARQTSPPPPHHRGATETLRGIGVAQGNLMMESKVGTKRQNVSSIGTGELGEQAGITEEENSKAKSLQEPHIGLLPSIVGENKARNPQAEDLPASESHHSGLLSPLSPSAFTPPPPAQQSNNLTIASEQTPVATWSPYGPISEYSTFTADSELSPNFKSSAVSQIWWGYSLLSWSFGCTYVIAWAISFYPQVWMNYRRKSVAGLSFDLVVYNIIGYIAYSVYTIVQACVQRYFDAPEAVEVHDTFFALHSLAVCVWIGVQILVYDRGNQKLGKLCIYVCIGMVAAVAVHALLAFNDIIPWVVYPAPDNGSKYLLGGMDNDNHSGNNGQRKPVVAKEEPTSHNRLLQGLEGSRHVSGDVRHAGLLRRRSSTRQLAAEGSLMFGLMGHANEPADGTNPVLTTLTGNREVTSGRLAQAAQDRMREEPQDEFAFGQTTATQWSLTLFLGYLKVGITVVKYNPQVYLNYINQATDGVSIISFILDLVGGLFSLAQNCLDAYNYSDDSYIFGNLPKFGISLVTLFYDAILIFQHFVLYRRPRRAQYLQLRNAMQQRGTGLEEWSTTVRADSLGRGRLVDVKKTPGERFPSKAKPTKTQGLGGIIGKSREQEEYAADQSTGVTEPDNRSGGSARSVVLQPSELYALQTENAPQAAVVGKDQLKGCGQV